MPAGMSRSLNRCGDVEYVSTGSSNGMPISRAMTCQRTVSAHSTNVTAVPAAPARPVRPIRWM